MDRAALQQLYVRYGPMVLRRARALLRQEQAAQDALQEVVLRAVRALGDSPELARAFESGAPEGSDSAATWLYRTTTSYCLNALRERAQLSGVLASIPHELIELAHYYLIDALTQDEIAALLGVPRATVGDRLDELRATARTLAPLSGAS
jgi:RNA polymerase sigma-70 factor, ECF subfamily